MTNALSSALRGAEFAIRAVFEALRIETPLALKLLNGYNWNGWTLVFRPKIRVGDTRAPNEGVAIIG